MMQWLGANSLVVLALLTPPVDAFLSHREIFTSNAVCTQKYCINPIFPGLKDLGRLESSRWVCSTHDKVGSLLSFCKGAVDYAPSLPSLDQTTDVATLVKAQEKAAITAFAFHLSGMGIEALDHTRPSEDEDECIKSTWKLVCYTYFPKAERGCKEGQEGRYLRPCQNSCGSYVQQCGVECCDESVQCVFDHERPVNKTSTMKTSGYVSMNGPSPHCTGGESGSATRSPHFLVLLLVLVALSLQGCELDSQLDIPSHQVGNWRKEPDYLVQNAFIPPGSSARNARINSCAEDLAPTLQCSGRGSCKAWNPIGLDSGVTMCECDRDWADPECRTPRKSQTYAYILSLFLGWLGADQFYLGWIFLGSLKACTLGGFGVWWLLDIIRLGAAPVHAFPYRVAADLPHWAFVLSLFSFFSAISFAVVGTITLQHRMTKRKDVMLMQAEEEARLLMNGDQILPSYDGKRYAVPQYSATSSHLFR